MEFDGVHELAADLSIDADSTLSNVYVDGVQVSACALSRSELLRKVRSTPGPAKLPVCSEAYVKWASFDMRASNHDTPADLAELLRVASFLIDNEGTLVAARRLAAAARAPLRATVRLLRTLPAVRLPACNPSSLPPHGGMRDVIAALATLSHHEIASVLLHLDPFELIHLPWPLLRAGLARYATSATAHPLDLRDPLLMHHPLPAPSMAIPLWRIQCDHLLDIVSHINDDNNRNVHATPAGVEVKIDEELTLAALKLSYVSPITSAALERVAGTLSALQIFSPPVPAHVAFLRAATRLTELSLVSACPPRGSLLAALETLSLLRTLEVTLPALSPEDSALMRASLDGSVLGVSNHGAASCSRNAAVRAPGVTQLAAALAGLTHAHLHTFSRDGGGAGGPAWPPMLAHFLPIPSLESFTCHPYTLPREDFPLLSPIARAARSGGDLQARTLSLCWPDRWPLPGGRPPAAQRELDGVSGADADGVFTAAAAAMPHLRAVALDCRACDTSAHLEPLLQLTHIQSLRLEDLELSVAVAATKWLQGLQCLRELSLGMLPPPASAREGDDGGRERLFRTLVKGLRLQEKPLTLLAFADVPLTPATCAALGALSTLRELSWSITDATDAAPHGDTVAALAAMLRSCSPLTTLRIPLWPRAADAGALVASLVSLRTLRELTVVFHAPAAAPEALAGTPGAVAAADAATEASSGCASRDGAAAGAAHACLLALEVLHVRMTGGHGGHLTEFVEQLNLQAPLLTALKLQCDEAAEASQPQPLVRTLERVPHLRTLHLPGSCMRAAEDAAVVGPAICRLPGLQELIFWGSVGVMGEAWRAVVQLPLCRGLVEVPLRAEE